MDLRTTYLGFDLPHPLVPGASPLGADLDAIRRLEDAGAPAIVLPSLFEEQVVRDEMAAGLHVRGFMDSHAEAMSYLPDPSAFEHGPFEYLEHVHRVRAQVGVPVIASLNGTTQGCWLDYAGLVQDAGADALELNVYRLASDPEVGAVDLERETVAMVRAVRSTVSIPLAVKLSPFYTSLPAFARELALAGAAGLVLFNRFLQPDIDLEELRAVPRLEHGETSLPEISTYL